MNLSEVGLNHLQVTRLNNAGYYTLEELPNTRDGLVAIDGCGPKTADLLLDAKRRVAVARNEPSDRLRVIDEDTAVVDLDPKAKDELGELADFVSEELAAEKPSGAEVKVHPVAGVEEKGIEKPSGAEELDQDVTPTAAFTRYQFACLAALDRQLGRHMERWVYTYITSLSNGTSRKEACAAAGRKGVIATDQAAYDEILRLALHYTLVSSRDFAPPPGQFA